jgi:D-sedoheptulose 7-phosphate isomerase
LDLASFFKAEFAEHHDVARRSEAALSNRFAELVRACTKSIQGGGKLLFFGNGGSAADALTTDTSALTAAANDLGFERVFSRQIEALGKPGDVAIGISTSGKSANVIAALKQARSMRLVTAAFTGQGGSELSSLTDHLLAVPSATTARIQEMHITLGQMLCGALEIELGLAPE